MATRTQTAAEHGSKSDRLLRDARSELRDAYAAAIAGRELAALVADAKTAGETPEIPWRHFGEARVYIASPLGVADVLEHVFELSELAADVRRKPPAQTIWCAAVHDGSGSLTDVAFVDVTPGVCGGDA